ncbi:PPIC-type PPIASE domain-containing protein [Besnoitia besnoiti]|uniref:PPIC-type PPIASE domain-containing protein n=1 Tax=Besnoitia besnoiti TaxID=94643 RepID=A0A2A9MCQ3_BESBE|nr:PPIC-type PPIASE domain-containing protein [Besnoitia besnoiti]PFH35004.1 PPIC-type PPIASE domain-containing protein [Besnoitia besnoiti]
MRYLSPPDSPSSGIDSDPSVAPPPAAPAELSEAQSHYTRQRSDWQARLGVAPHAAAPVAPACSSFVAGGALHSMSTQNKAVLLPPSLSSAAAASAALASAASPPPVAPGPAASLPPVGVLQTLTGRPGAATAVTSSSAAALVAKAFGKGGGNAKFAAAAAAAEKAAQAVAAGRSGAGFAPDAQVAGEPVQRFSHIKVMKEGTCLEVFCLPVMFKKIAPRDRLILGRGEQADVHTEHPSCSRLHAELRRVEGAAGSRCTYSLRDLGSGHGTLLNGGKIAAGKETELEDEDEIQFGFSQRLYIFFSGRDSLEDTSEPPPAAQSACLPPRLSGDVEGPRGALPHREIENDSRGGPRQAPPRVPPPPPPPGGPHFPLHANGNFSPRGKSGWRRGESGWRESGWGPRGSEDAGGGQGISWASDNGTQQDGPFSSHGGVDTGMHGGWQQPSAHPQWRNSAGQPYYDGGGAQLRHGGSPFPSAHWGEEGRWSGEGQGAGDAYGALQSCAMQESAAAGGGERGARSGCSGREEAAPDLHNWTAAASASNWSSFSPAASAMSQYNAGGSNAFSSTPSPYYAAADGGAPAHGDGFLPFYGEQRGGNEASCAGGGGSCSSPEKSARPFQERGPDKQARKKLWQNSKSDKEESSSRVSAEQDLLEHKEKLIREHRERLLQDREMMLSQKERLLGKSEQKPAETPATAVSASPAPAKRSREGSELSDIAENRVETEACVVEAGGKGQEEGTSQAKKMKLDSAAPTAVASQQGVPAQQSRRPGSDEKPTAAQAYCSHILLKFRRGKEDGVWKGAASSAPGKDRQALVGRGGLPVTRTRSDAISSLESVKQIVAEDTSQFGEFAAELSDCPSSRMRGLLGWVSRDTRGGACGSADGESGDDKRWSLPAEVVQAALQMKVGAVSAVIESEHGAHLLYRVK